MKMNDIKLEVRKREEEILTIYLKVVVLWYYRGYNTFTYVFNSSVFLLLIFN